MTSKVLVKLPTVPFSQGKKSAPELMTLPTKNEGPAQVRPHQTVNGDRTAQLEQNMKFLQEQHQATLIALHQEVETLRQRNRDLQFQLVFSKNTNCVQSTPSSPEDNSNGFVKTKGSPLCVNVTPLQVELLEKDLDEIKVSFNEVKKHNQYLLEVIDKQNKKSQQPEKRKEKSEMADVGVQAGESAEAIEGDSATRLELAQALVKCLRRRNNNQEREIERMKKAALMNCGSRYGSDKNRCHDNCHHNRGADQGNTGQGPHFHKFPPLQTQSYWHGGARGNHSFDHNTEYHRNGRRRQDKQQDRDSGVDGTVLPQLRNSKGKPEFSRGYHDEDGDYYRERGNRRYRGQRSQRDTEAQDMESKQDQQQKDLTANGTQPQRKQ